MSDAPALSARGLSKRFETVLEPPTSLRERVEMSLRTPGRGRRGRQMTVEALDDVSFEVAEGEAFGIIGRNGAGKTTLLSILAGVTAPSAGTATIYGRLASLLAVGTGFHPELTGRDNVFLNGTVLGMRKGEIARRFDEIVEFSEIGRFIDVPVKRYSSGMYVRLAFSVAAHLDPEVMLLDEVLSVGDRQFREKCHARVAEITKDGRTVVVVSHDMSSMLAMCDRALVLEQGAVAFVGPSTEAASIYAAMTGALDADAREGTGEIRIARMTTMSELGDVAARSNGPLRVSVELETSRPRDAAGVVLKVGVHARGGLLAELSTEIEPESPLGSEITTGTVLVCVVERLPLRPGEYWLSARLERSRALIDRVDRRATFWVVPADVHGTGFLPSDRDRGAVVVTHRWHLADLHPPRPPALAGGSRVP